MNRVSHDARSEDERGAMVTVAEFTVTEVCPQCGQTITIDVSV
jgi:predicted RNA-binding Zn-ribbon protein involved in translation (DUF1610 family)